MKFYFAQISLARGCVFEVSEITRLLVEYDDIQSNILCSLYPQFNALAFEKGWCNRAGKSE